MLKIAVLISGGGSNLESIMDNIDSGYLDKIKIEYVISDREAKGIEKAKNRGYKTKILNRNLGVKSLNDDLNNLLLGKVDLIVLAGFLSILTNDLIKNFENKIINIHPSLIPCFCGKGMYGIKVHEAAIEKGVKFAGCTVHLVNSKIDDGAIIDQEIVEIKQEYTAKELQEKVLQKEHVILPKVIKLLSEDRVVIKNNRAIILN
ncbi:MAG: phosphoribosylglycinamide formyltransferase [Sarcina sp.]